MRRDWNYARLMLAVAIAVAAGAMLGAWYKFDYRAAGIVFCGAGAAVIAMLCLNRLNELREGEKDAPVELKCRDCGETFNYYPLKNPPKDRANERPLRCPLCGGELTEAPRSNPLDSTVAVRQRRTRKPKGFPTLERESEEERA